MVELKSKNIYFDSDDDRHKYKFHGRFDLNFFFEDRVDRLIDIRGTICTIERLLDEIESFDGNESVFSYSYTGNDKSDILFCITTDDENRKEEIAMQISGKSYDYWERITMEDLLFLKERLKHTEKEFIDYLKINNIDLPTARLCTSVV